MCDYSLHNVASRDAKVGDKLRTTNFANLLGSAVSLLGSALLLGPASRVVGSTLPILGTTLLLGSALSCVVGTARLLAPALLVVIPRTEQISKSQRPAHAGLSIS